MWTAKHFCLGAASKGSLVGLSPVGQARSLHLSLASSGLPLPEIHIQASEEPFKLLPLGESSPCLRKGPDPYRLASAPPGSGLSLSLKPGGVGGAGGAMPPLSGPKRGGRRSWPEPAAKALKRLVRQGEVSKDPQLSNGE